MRFLAATLTSLLLMAASFAMLVWANEAMDVAAIVGGTGLVVAGAFLGLTILAWRWRNESGAYATTVVDSAGFYDDLAAAFDADGAVDRGDDAVAS